MSASPEFAAEELSELLHELRHLWHALAGTMRQGGRLEGLQRQQFWVLGALAHGPRRMSELAECAQTSQASLTGIVDRLEEHGLVERVRSSEDRRVVEVALTECGRDEMRASQARKMAQLGEMLEPLTADERREFLRLVRRLAAGAQKPDPAS